MRARWAVWLATAVYAVVLTTVAWLRYRNLGAGYDLAIFDQATWLWGHGHPAFSTVRGMPLLADHFDPSVALLTPLGALSLGAYPLLAAQAIALALVAPLLFAIARRRGAGEGVALVVALAWLASPLTQRTALFDFHPECFAPALIAAGLLALEDDRLWLFALTAVLACGLKEDIALVYVAWGIVLVLQRRRRLGGAVAVAGIAWFAFALKVAIPAGGGDLDYFSHRFGGGRSSTVGSVVADLFRHPIASLHALVTRINLQMLVGLVASTLGLCLLGWELLALGVPTVAANLLSRYPQQHYLTLQYHLVPAAIAAIAAAWGARRLRRILPPSVPGRLLAALAVAGIAAELALTPIRGSLASPSPIAASRRDAARAALALVPPGVPVAAQHDLVARLAERRDVYVLPLPFVLPDDGEAWTRSQLDGRLARLHWVILDEQGQPYPGTDAQLAEVKRLLPGLGFRRIFDRDGFVVLRR